MNRLPSLVLILTALQGCTSDLPPAESPASEEPAAEAPPGITLELLAPGTVSGPGNETFPAVDPVTGDLWFSRYDDDFDQQTLYRAEASGSDIATPRIASFSGQWGDRAPRFSPDGGRLYFTSNRPVPGATASGDMNLWLSEREVGSWGEPRLVPGVRSDGPEIHASATDHALWFASVRADGFGRSDVYRAALPLDGTRVEHVSARINDERSQPDLFVAPDESWMIVVVTDHPDGLGGDDLFLVRRDGETWGEPEHLPAPINSPEYEYGPWLDGRSGRLLFTSHRHGHADIFHVPLSSVLGG